MDEEEEARNSVSDETDSESDDSNSERMVKLAPAGGGDRFFSYTDTLSTSSIHCAVRLGDLQRVKRIINKGKSPNVTDNFGNTSLHTAVIANKLEIMKYLLSLPDINIDARTYSGETALLMSLSLNLSDVANELIEKSADITIGNLESETPLHRAVKMSLYSIARRMIEANADVNAADMDGYTPLHEAIMLNDFEMVSMLLYYGADTSLRICYGLTPFMLALSNAASNDIQEELFRYEADFNTLSYDSCSVLFFAINSGSPLITDIIKNGADVNYNVEGRTSLDMTLFTEQPGTFYYIFSIADLSVLTDSNYSIFHSLMKCTFPVEDWLKISFLLITCDNAFELVHHYVDNKLESFIAELANGFSKRNIPEEEFCKFVSICLLYGIEVTYEDVKRVYFHYGNNLVLPRLLEMKIHDLNREEKFSMPMLFCNIKLGISSLIAKIDLEKDAFSLINNILNFCTPDETLRNNILALKKPYVNEQYFDIFKRLQQRAIPSLIELSRDKSREFIVCTFNLEQSHWFYYILRRLHLPKIIQDIITCRKPIYFY